MDPTVTLHQRTNNACLVGVTLVHTQRLWGTLECEPDGGVWQARNCLAGEFDDKPGVYRCMHRTEHPDMCADVCIELVALHLCDACASVQLAVRRRGRSGRSIGSFVFERCRGLWIAPDDLPGERRPYPFTWVPDTDLLLQ